MREPGYLVCDSSGARLWDPDFVAAIMFEGWSEVPVRCLRSVYVCPDLASRMSLWLARFVAFICFIFLSLKMVLKL